MQNRSSALGGALLVVVALIVGCDQEDGVGYCKNHFAFHADHAASAGKLDIAITQDGNLQASLVLPDAVVGGEFSEDTLSLLANSRDVLELQTSSAPCPVSVDAITSSDAGVDVELSAGCGPDSRLRRVDVPLFDYLPGMSEVVVSVTTPATAKRFGISRRCNSPIFKLD